MKVIQGKDSGFYWHLKMMGIEYIVVFKVAVQVIIGDCKGNDTLCGKYGTHSKNSRSFCRDCKVTYDESDDASHHCIWIEPSDVIGKPKKEVNNLGFHKINNAFDSIDFGAQKLGIYGSTPSEPLHAFKLGLCKKRFHLKLLRRLMSD